MDTERFDELLRTWQEGDASAAELAELESLLRAHPDYRRDLVNSIRLEVELYGKYSTSPAAERPQAGLHALPAARPFRRMRALESMAAVLTVAVSLLAVSYFLYRYQAEDSPYRVAQGEVYVDGTPARSFAENAPFEVRGLTPALIELKDGSRLVLVPGSAGLLRRDGEAARQVFVLSRGGGKFAVGANSRPFRVEGPEGSVSASAADFSVQLQLPGFSVAVAAGDVEVEYAGARHGLRARENVQYGLPPSGELTSAREAGKWLRAATLTLAEAIEKALAAVPGTPVEAGLDDEDGQITFSVHVAHDGSVTELELDAKTGAVLDRDTDKKDRSKLLAASTTSLAGAVQAALAKVPGDAIDTEAELRDGRAQAAVEILREGKTYEVLVDLAAGTVTRVSAPGEDK